MGRQRETAGATEPVKDIIKAMQKIEAISHYHGSEVYSDFLALTEAALRSLPRHADSVVLTGQMAEDDEETAKLWARMRQRYENGHRYDGKTAFELFKEAFHILLQAVEDTPLREAEV